ncbi:copper resistance CopC/CopD family protein [Actinacidiphila epipremni]|uniref:Copper resistance protein CopC/CopD n=1 Tax=Actinacidiphila epipremni TaxID=2053013 RepID=A0ABX0ZQ96_9ACTN|nr:copper resistance protein CopC [Actinacidiphila epipremni]NJP43979.1 copper resistance protein CopC/CopD [Actinacidiphila epipremni]
MRGRAGALVRALGAALVLACAVLIAAPGTAAAHASLLSSSPADGAVLAHEPAQVTLVFSEPVTLGLSSVSVVGPSGRRVEQGAPVAAGPGGDRLRVRLAPDLRTGTYVLTWRTTATDDGHTTSGALTFSVGSPGAASGPASATGGGGDRTTDAILDVAIWLGFAGLAGMVGFTAVRLCCAPAESGRAAAEDEGGGATRGNAAEQGQCGGVTAGGVPGGDAAGSGPGAIGEGVPGWWGLRWPGGVGWGVLLVGTLGQLLVHGPATQGESVGHAFERALLSASLASHVGHTLVARLMLLALVAAVGEQVLRHRRAGAVGGAVLAVLLALTWSEISHAPDQPMAPLAVLLTALHVTAMAVWAGGVATLAVLLLRHREPQLADTARRFGRVALGAVAVLLVTGLVQAYREVGTLGAVTGTRYGRLLLVKVALAVLVLAVAAARHARSRRAGGKDQGGHVRRSVLLELGGLTGVLVATVVLLSTAPAASHVPAKAPASAPAPATAAVTPGG